jgi:agmatinase/guanidinopropionase
MEAEMRSQFPDGHRIPRFAGIATFCRLPHTRDLQDVDVAVVGVPFDGGASYRPGARYGPRKIREASALLREYNPVQDVEPFHWLRIVDYGDTAVNPASIEETHALIEADVDPVVRAGAFPMCLGGDHSVSLPLLRAVARRYGPLALVQFDAHPDTWNVHFGRRYTHATPFRRAVEEGVVDARRSIQIGIRGPLPHATDLEDARALGFAVVTADDVARLGITETLHQVHERASGPVYLTLDIDAVDPAYAPGTGTPEVGGFTSREVLALVRGLAGLEVVAADVVEVSPPYDHGDITSILAANLAYEVICLVARRRRSVLASRSANEEQRP